MVMLGRNLVASAAQIQMARGQLPKLGENWQDELWEIYEHLGPVHYGVNFKRNAASKVDYFVAEYGEDTDEPQPSEDAAAREAFDRLGNVKMLVSEMVAHTNVVGEGFLVGQDRDEEETFSVWSAEELSESDKGSKRHADARPEIVDDDFVLRIWRSSPVKSYLPDSPLRSVQTQCEQLLLLNEQIGAVAQSRLSAGILLVPSELSFQPNAEDPPATGANAGGDPLMAEIIQIATVPISDSGSASRVAPAIIRGRSEYLEKIRQLDFARDIDKTFAEMREELLRQIAAGLDLPAEILTGLADLNHWSLWGIDESTAKLHVDPDVLLVLDGMTTGYLHPMLEEAGVRDPERFLIWRDYSDLTSRPLNIADAMSMFDKQILDADEVKRIANIAPDDDDADDAVGPADIAKRSEAVGVLFRAGFEPQAILAALGMPSITHTGAAPITVQSEDEIESDGVPSDERAIPVTAAASVSLDPLGEIDRNLAARAIEASEAAFVRAMERAGAKIRAKAKKDRDLTASISGVANVDVGKTLGQARIERLQLTDDQLVPSDTFDPLAKRLRALISKSWQTARSELARLTGIDPGPEKPEDTDDAIVGFITALLALAVSRLFTDAPDPDPAETGEITDGIVTGQMVYEMMSTAGGAGVVSRFTPDTPRGLALGQRVRASLIDAGYLVETETWVYGDPSLRRTNFEPHRRLDGKVDPKVAGPAWLGVEFMFPGDHRGCDCQLVPTVQLAEGVS